MSKRYPALQTRPALRPLPLLDTLRRGTWQSYAQRAADTLRGDVLTVINKRKGFVQAYVVRFGPCPATGLLCELGFFIFESEIRFFDGIDEEPFVLKHVKDARAAGDAFEIVAESEGARTSLRIRCDGGSEFRVAPLPQAAG